MKHLRVENLETYNWEGAFRGMRNPLESWGKSDSEFISETRENNIGKKDLELAMKLVKGGQPHRKFLRQIFISCDIIAPWLFWKEWETYQVGTVENSTSQMFKMGSRVLDTGDFVFSVFDRPIDRSETELWEAHSETLYLLEIINNKIERWREHKEDGKYGNIFWRDLIESIPGAYIYRRTCTFNYEVLSAMYKWRHKHKLEEWREFCSYMRENLPYPQLFIGEDI